MENLKNEQPARDFFKVLKRVDDTLYTPNGFIISNLEEEKQNSEYGAGLFKLTSSRNSKTVRFRVAKITPHKIGQFVSFWKKNKAGINQPFLYDNVPDLLVVTVFKNESLFGQFVFPKEVLKKKGVLKSTTTKGKMAMRVYPSWDNPENKTAIAAQLWQLEYFFTIDDVNSPNNQKISALYQS